MERSIRPVTFPSNLPFSSVPLSVHLYLTFLFFIYFGESSNGLKSLTVFASANQAALLSVPQPVLIQHVESFHLPTYAPA